MASGARPVLTICAESVLATSVIVVAPMFGVGYENAGVADSTPVDEMSLETWHKVIETNLTSAFLCSRAAFRRMKGKGRGRIINVGSISARVT